MLNNLILEPHTIKFEKPTIALFAGIALGMFILAYTGLGTRWMVGFSLGLVILFVGLSLKNPKHFFLALFAFALPIQVVNYLGRLSPSLATHTGGPAGLYVTLLDFPLLMLYIFWISKIFISKTVKFSFSKLDICIIGLILTSILSITNAPFLNLSLYGIVQLLKVYLIFLYFANEVKTKRTLYYFITFILAGVLFQDILGILQFYGGEKFIIPFIGRQDIIRQKFLIGMASRVSGTLAQPNHLAIFLNFFIPLSVILSLILEKKKLRILCSLIFLISFFTLVLTLSRGGWISFIISMTVLFLVSIKVKLFPFKKAVAITIIGLIILGVIVLASQGLVFNRLFSDDYGAALSRIPLMKVAFSMIKAQPFLGIGINNYAEAMWHYDNTIEQISSAMPWVVHNQYLFIASEVGLVGLLFFLYFLVLLYKSSIRILHYGDSFHKSIAIAFLAATAGFLLHLMVDCRPLTSPVFICFWTYAGLIKGIEGMQNYKIRYKRKIEKLGSQSDNVETT